MKLIIILIITMGGLGGMAKEAGADGCLSRNEMIVTAPRNGAKTMQPSIMIRGYVCANHPLVTVRNQTTAFETVTETSEVCEGSECTYHFAVPVRGLALGENHITATIPGEDEAVELEVTRTALAGL